MNTIYLDEKSINEIGINWKETIHVIEETLTIIKENDYVQPIKPYLRYKDFKNRIIAMPSYVGGNIDIAGIKWIASFPGNNQKHIPRAHCVVILNDADNGFPLCIINTPLISIIRTASVSGAVLDSFLKARKRTEIKLGIIGWGPIGIYHYKMCMSLFGDLISDVFIYDLNKINNLDLNENTKIKITSNWEEAYLNSDIFITCTVSDKPYINLKPKNGSLHLNISLRDYTIDTFRYFKDSIIVDNWEEVCRESTDVELFHKYSGLQKNDTFLIFNILHNDFWEKFNPEYPILFNPMGMSVFDISISKYYYLKCIK